jgi:Na+/glutamate symporter
VTTAATSAVKVVAGLETASAKLVPLLDKKDRVLATAFTLTLARLICSSGDAVQRFLPAYPGLSTLAITVTAAAAAALGKRVNPDAYATVAVVAPSTAGFLMTLFFGAMGASARLSELFKGGPALLSFALLALIMHSVFIVGVSACVSVINRLYSVVVCSMSDGWRSACV